MRDFIKLAPSVWQSKRFQSLSDDGKLLYLYFLSSPHINSAGYYKLHPGYMMADLDWKNDRIEKGIKEVEKSTLILYDSSESLLLIDRFYDFNPPTNPKHASKIFSDILSIGYSDLKSECLARFSACLRAKGWKLSSEMQDQLTKAIDSLSKGYDQKRRGEEKRGEGEERIQEAKELDLKSDDPDEIFICFEKYNKFAKEFNLSNAQVLSDKRRSAIRARLKECGGISGFEICLEKIKESDFLLGKKTDWKADLDFIIKKDKFISIMEGKYSNVRPTNSPQGSPEAELADYMDGR